MGLNENKENTEIKTENKKWKAWEKNLLAGAICFTIGLSGPIAVSMYVKHQTKTAQQATIDRLREEKRSLKKQLETQKEKIVTVPVYITEPVTESKETAPVTEIVETETITQKAESILPETEAPEDNEYQVKVLSNPLTKTQPYKSKPPAPAMYTVYWIDVKRSDLASMTSSDFQFFIDYISEKYKTDDIVYFYIRITDYPEIIIDCSVYKEYTMFVCNSKYDDTAKCDVGGYTICEMNVSDPNQITLTGYEKDEYGLPRASEYELRSFSEFDEDLWAYLTILQGRAKFRFG